jgi:hypothetical protein
MLNQESYRTTAFEKGSFEDFIPLRRIIGCKDSISGR